MSGAEMRKKLVNAITDYRGRLLSNGQWFRPPNASAKDRVDRWAFRCRHAGVITEQEEMEIKSLKVLVKPTKP